MTAHIQVFFSADDAVPGKLSREEAKNLLKSDREFNKIVIIQDGIRGIIGDMYVTIYNMGPAAEAAEPATNYLCKMSSNGWSSSFNATRDKLYTSLTDGRGLWTLM
jgi:hypothetical protein